MDEIRLHVGEQTELILPGLGSAGYQWFVTVDDPSVARVVSQSSAPRSGSGASGSFDQKFAVMGLFKGQTMLHFAQKRAFDPNRPPHATRDILVRVD